MVKEFYLPLRSWEFNNDSLLEVVIILTQVRNTGNFTLSAALTVIYIITNVKVTTLGVT